MKIALASPPICPDGTCLVHQRYGEPGITLCNIHPEKATGFLAKRFKPIDDDH